MQTLVLGILILFGVIFSSVFGSSSTFFVTHSVLLVVVGSLGVLFLSTPNKVFLELIKALKKIGSAESSITIHKKSLDLLAANKFAKVETVDPILNYAMELWAQGLEPALFSKLLMQKKREIDMRNLDVVQALKNLAKYPPALGMIGTVIGMIGLFGNLDKNRDSIGHHLSIAMTATFLGLVLANVVISPLADRMQIYCAKTQQLNSHLCELLLMMNQGEAVSLIVEEINGRAA